MDNQDLKKQSIRLQNEKARQASDLALAIAVLEAVGVLPKEVSESRAAYGAHEPTTPQAVLHPAAGSGSLRSQPTPNGCSLRRRVLTGLEVEEEEDVQNKPS